MEKPQHSNAMKRRWADPDFRLKMKLIWADPNRRQRRSAAAKKLWEDPQYREARAEGHPMHLEPIVEKKFNRPPNEQPPYHPRDAAGKRLRVCGIFSFNNTKTGVRFIGYSEDCYAYLKFMIQGLDRQDLGPRALKSAWFWDRDAFEVEILEENLDPFTVERRAQAWIAYFRARSGVYNGERFDLGKELTPSEIASIANLCAWRRKQETPSLCYPLPPLSPAQMLGAIKAKAYEGESPVDRETLIPICER